MDHCICGLLTRNPDGTVVQPGVDLETTFWRDDNGHTPWYGVNLPYVIDYRKQLLSGAGRETPIAGSTFDEDWLEQVLAERPDVPLPL